MFNLDKGSSFALDKAVSQFTIGLGWDVGDNSNYDLDAHCFGCVAGPKLYNSGSHAVTYANSSLKKNGKAFGAQDDSIVSTGDNLTGAGDGADEEIIIDIAKIPAGISELLVFLTIHDAKNRNQHFGQVKNSFCSITDKSTGKELCRYNLKDEFAGCVSIQVGNFTKDASGVWTFAALGAGLQTETLGDILKMLQ
jgi:tellurium resistance protein TerD